MHRPGFRTFITEKYEGRNDNLRGFGFWFHDPNRPEPEPELELESERYSMLIYSGMSPQKCAESLEAVAKQMRERSGKNGTSTRQQYEVNRSDFPGVTSNQVPDYEKV